MQIDIVTVMNVLGVLAFAFVGAMKAIREELDLLGIFVLGLVTALGGGVIRDGLTNEIPYAFSAYFDVLLSGVGVVAASVVYKLLQRDLSNCYYIMIPDALGLATFTMTGAMIAYQREIFGMGLVFLAVITAVGGGMIADLLLGRIPSVLKEDCYATCSLIGACGFCLAMSWNIDITTTSVFCSLLTFLLRIFALKEGWSLPKLSA